MFLGCLTSKNTNGHARLQTLARGLNFRTQGLEILDVEA